MGPIDPDNADTGDLRGPLAYRNWHAMERVAQPLYGTEVFVYGDAPAIGGHWRLGPYEVFNTIAGVANMRGEIAPPLALRAWVHLHHDNWFPSLDRTDVTGFTGSDLADEIACLLSLLSARRLRAGDTARMFNSVNDLGTPRAERDIDIPITPGRARRLPRQAEPFALADELRDLLAFYPHLNASNAVALARAARAYRDALWLGERHPELAWLLFVSAIESAANARVSDANPDAVERLRTGSPELYREIQHLAPEALASLARRLAHLVKATNKFLDFMARFGPRVGPAPRPTFAGLGWNDDAEMRGVYRKVYDHRSRALHEAVAIPFPMLLPPDVWQAGAGHDEKPSGLASGALGGAWAREDAPMLLHAFEFAVQHALVAWWKELAVTPVGLTSIP